MPPLSGSVTTSGSSSVAAHRQRGDFFAFFVRNPEGNSAEIQPRKDHFLRLPSLPGLPDNAPPPRQPHTLALQL